MNNVFYQDWSFQKGSNILTQNKLGIHGFWKVRAWECIEVLQEFLRGSKLAKPFWGEDIPNGITDAGIHYLLEVGFRSDAGMPVSQIAPWYGLLIDDAGYTGVDASDTMSSHTGWTENEDYDEAARQQFAFAAAASRKITDDISFTMNAGVTIRGIGVTSVSTKGGSTGILWSTALFSSPPALISGNVLTPNYSLSD